MNRTKASQRGMCPKASALGASSEIILVDNNFKVHIQITVLRARAWKMNLQVFTHGKLCIQKGDCDETPLQIRSLWNFSREVGRGRFTSPDLVQRDRVRECCFFFFLSLFCVCIQTLSAGIQRVNWSKISITSKILQYVSSSMDHMKCQNTAVPLRITFLSLVEKSKGCFSPL